MTEIFSTHLAFLSFGVRLITYNITVMMPNCTQGTLVQGQQTMFFKLELLKVANCLYDYGHCYRLFKSPWFQWVLWGVTKPRLVRGSKRDTNVSLQENTGDTGILKTCSDHVSSLNLFLMISYGLGFFLSQMWMWWEMKKKWGILKYSLRLSISCLLNSEPFRNHQKCLQDHIKLILT